MPGPSRPTPGSSRSAPGCVADLEEHVMARGGQAAPVRPAARRATHRSGRAMRSAPRPPGRAGPRRARPRSPPRPSPIHAPGTIPHDSQRAARATWIANRSEAAHSQVSRPEDGPSTPSSARNDQPRSRSHRSIARRKAGSRGRVAARRQREAGPVGEHEHRAAAQLRPPSARHHGDMQLAPQEGVEGRRWPRRARRRPAPAGARDGPGVRRPSRPGRAGPARPAHRTGSRGTSGRGPPGPPASGPRAG